MINVSIIQSSSWKVIIVTTAVNFAVTELRNLIIRGRLSVGERVTETSGANLLGLSRTPLREALGQLEREGLLEKLQIRGYKVRAISIEDVESAAALRGVVEGYAAGQLAAMGPNAKVTKAMQASIAMTEIVINAAELTVTEIGQYQEANTLFHNTIVEECQNTFVVGALEKVQQIPIVTPGSFVKLGGKTKRERLRLTVGHSQHIIIWDAILNRDAIRAENMMREHANAPLRYAELFLGEDVTKVLPESLKRDAAGLL